MHNNLSIGLVTVLYNSDSLLDGFLKSLSIQDFKNYHLYFVDNTPSEATDVVLAKLLELYNIKNFSHLKSVGNIGVAAGNNVGIKAALANRHDYVLLLNNDIEFTQPDVLSGLLDVAVQRGEKLLIPKIYYYDSGKVWMAGAHYYKYKALSRHTGELKEDSPIYDKEKYCNYAPTCFMLIESSVFDEIGFMDEKYFVYYDDTDFIYRAVKKGYRILYIPKYRIQHKVSTSTGGWTSPFTIYYGNRNRLYFIRKNLPFLEKYSSYLYFFLTRIPKWVTNNKIQNENLIKGIRDGFRL